MDMKEMLRKWVSELLIGDITSSGSWTNDLPEKSSVLDPSINVSKGDLLRARSSCLSDLPPLQVHMDLLQWSTHLTNRFIAELLKPYTSCTTVTPPPHGDGKNESHQAGPCFPRSTTSTFPWHHNENTDEMTFPCMHEATIKTEPWEMEEGMDLDSKEGTLLEEPSHYSTQTEGPPIPDESGTLSDDSGIAVCSSPEHKIRVTKDVPASYAYWLRGVRCPICRFCFRGQSCVSEVVEHVRTGHADESSPEVIKKLLEDTKVEKVIGPGILYCGCQLCLEAARISGYRC